jgi:hypothetical protein
MAKSSNSRGLKVLRPLFVVTSGFILAICFHLDVIFPIWLSFLLGTFILVHVLRLGGTFTPMISKYFLVVYCLPFIHGIEYIFFDFDNPIKPEIMWGLATNAYTFSQPIIERMFMLALIGQIGFLIPILLVSRSCFQGLGEKPATALCGPESMRFSRFCIFLAVAFILSSISTPKDTILQSAYAMGEPPVSTALNFNAAWLVSHVFIAFAFVDITYRRARAKDAWKKKAVFWLVFSYIIIFHQFLRGDRECLSLIAAILFLGLHKRYIAKGARIGISNRKKEIFLGFALGAIVVSIFVLSNIVGTLRSSMSSAPISEIASGLAVSLSRVYCGTWSAVLLTPLSIVGDHYNGLMTFKYGTTYSDMIMSIPPGFVAKWIGYVRPFESSQGPAWSMRFGIGGTHGLVVPFMNFGAYGVLFISSVLSYFFTRIDLSYLKRPTSSLLSLIATLIVVGPHWFWYGDMSGIRGLMAFATAWFVSQILYNSIRLKELREIFVTGKIRSDSISAPN